MSRSIHDTWGVLSRTRRENYADPAEKLERILTLRANLAEQRALKQQTRHQRRRRGLSLPTFDPDRVAIVVSDESMYVHHSATEEDVRGVLRRLPPGMADGLCAIHLCPCDRPNRPGKQEVDPYTGTA